MSRPLITLDIGNTRSKWGVWDGMWLVHGVLENSNVLQLAQHLQQWPQSRALVSNVAGAALATQVTEQLATLHIEAEFIQAATQAGGLVNCYDHPQQLGSDRWLAAIAAWNLHHAPCVVATAGTALTVDAVSGQGEFLGGFIAPGWQAMHDTLVAATRLKEVHGEIASFPTNTADAVTSGVLHAMAGAVESMCSQLRQKEGSEPRCLLSGGDADKLLPLLPPPVARVDHLVLEGLRVLAGENA